MMANEHTSLSRVADREQLPLLLDKARQFAGHYIDSLEERPVFPGEKSLQAMHALVEPLPENPSDPFLVLDQLQEIGAPAVVTQTDGRYFGFVNGGILPVGLAAAACGAARLTSARMPLTKTNSFQPSFVQLGTTKDARTMNRSASVIAFRCSSTGLGPKAHCRPVRTAVAHTKGSSDLTALLVHLFGRRFRQAVRATPLANHPEAGHPTIMITHAKQKPTSRAKR